MPVTRSEDGGSRSPAAASSSVTICGSVLPPNGISVSGPVSPISSAIALTIARRPAPELNRMVPSMSNRTSLVAAISHSPLLQPSDGHESLPEDCGAASGKPGLDQHATASDRGVNQGIGVTGESHMGDRSSGLASEEQQIAGSDAIQRDRGAESNLLGRVPG